LIRLADQYEYDIRNTQGTLKQTTQLRHMHYIF